ncbi:MAG: hypothetical protein HKN68_08460 [Saprospiraceae bacterium]|nr:hypothetical protein [Saprospiraceae bacterium]
MMVKGSDALMEHMGNLGPVLGQLLEISSFSGEIYGDPSLELKKALDGMDVAYFSYLQGL